MEEIWKPVVGWEDRYEVSNIGRVKTMNYLNHGEVGYLKLCKNSNGYSYVNIYKEKGKKRNYVGVHRLVALAFIPNTDNKSQVNHINGIRTDNRFENLEWCTDSENAMHKYRVLGYKGVYQTNHQNTGKLGKDIITSKAVLQYDKNGNFIREWDSMMDVERKLGIDSGHISKCCKGKVKSSGGFVWKYKNPFMRGFYIRIRLKISRFHFHSHFHLKDKFLGNKLVKNLVSVLFVSNSNCRSLHR